MNTKILNYGDYTNLVESHSIDNLFESYQGMPIMDELNEGLEAAIKKFIQKLKKNLAKPKLSDLSPEQKIMYGLDSSVNSAKKIHLTDSTELIEPLRELREMAKAGKFKKDRDFIKFANAHYKKNVKRKVGMNTHIQVMNSPYEVFQGLPIVNAYYMYPNIFVGERFGMMFKKDILVFFKDAADSLWEEFLAVMKIVMDHEMLHRTQYIKRRRQKVGNIYDFFRSIITDANTFAYYSSSMEIEAHAQTTVKILKHSGFKKEEVLKLVNAESQNKNLNIIAGKAYGFKDLNKYFAKKGEIWKQYGDFVNKYAEEYYK